MAGVATRNNRPCWKCGQQVRHVRVSTRVVLEREIERGDHRNKGQRALWKQCSSEDVTVPVEHYVFKGKSYRVCRGSEATKR